MTNEIASDDNTRDGRFKELTEGYRYSFREKNERGIFTGVMDRKHIQMDIPLECSYQRTNIQGQRQEKIPHDHESGWQPEEKKNILREDPTNEDRHGYCTREGILEQAQKWGITLRQIRAIMLNIERRCVEEKWKEKNTDSPLTPETVTMYDVKEKIIMPFTEKSRKSFVETLPSTKGPQLPRHYLSYTWRVPFKEIVDTLEQFVEDFSSNYSRITDKQGGGMTDDTPIHITVFAVNQYDLMKKPGGLLPFSEFSSGIAQILELVKYRLITHLDQEGTVFERVWPVYDIFVTLMEKSGAGSWKIYITHNHEGEDGNEKKAVGLVPGGAPSDKYPIDTVLREKSFPIDLIESLIKYEVKNVRAYDDNDRINFLNFLTDEDMDDLYRDPPMEHSRYTEFQDAFRANFATPGTLQAALCHGDEHWKRMLNVMSKSNAPINLRFDFEGGKGWDDLTNFQAKELIRSLPKSTLRLKMLCASYGSSFVKELSDWIGKTKNLKTLRIEDTLINCGIIDGQHKVIKDLAKSLASSESLKRLEVWNSNVQENPIFVEMVKTLIYNDKIAEALFIKPFISLYAEDYPDFNKIKSLQTIFISTKHQVCDLPKKIKRETVDWAYALNKSDKADLLQSGAGPFLKTILNKEFSDRLNLSCIIMNVIVQIVLVTLLPTYTSHIETADHYMSNTIIFCIVWLCIIEMTQISNSTAKEHFSEEYNWVDFAQIVFLTIIIVIPDRLPGDYFFMEYAILVSYLALIFSLGNISFALAQFVDAMIEITKALVPFMFTTVLTVLAFTHTFRVRYSKEICPIDEIDPDQANFIGNWACTSIIHSYKKMWYMFLTDDDWYFDDAQSEHLMAIFAFAIGILLLNIVIAVVSNKFTDVQNDAEKVFWVRRLSLIKEVDSLMTFFKRLFYIKDTTDNSDRVRIREMAVQSLINGTNKRRRKRFSFNFIPSDDDDYADQKHIRLFFGWWFSPAGWGHAPRLSVRIYMFYLHSNWEDIVLPGKVFEKILLSCRYNEDLEENVGVIYIAKYFLVKLLTWVVLFIHGVIILAIIIVGFASFGLLWPRIFIERLFHRGVDEESESNSLNIKTFMEELNTKVDTLTALVNDTEDESNSIPTEEEKRTDNFVYAHTSDLVKMNTVVEELSTKVDTLTNIIGNLEKLVQNITPATTR